MPWAVFNRPSIQLSTLQTYLRARDANLHVETSHPYLTAAREISLETYRIISENPWAGEALYSALLFPERWEKAKQVFRRSLGRKSFRELPDFDRLVSQLDHHMNCWFDSHRFDEYSLVGFSVCFSQLPATLFAARSLKKLFPQMPVVLGGSTCSPGIGRSLLKVFPEIDYIINGEGEQPLLRLAGHIADRKKQPGKNIQYRQATASQSPQLHNDEIPDLNSLPFPDYDDYFSELKKTGLAFIPSLPLEFSRGCWWNKCTFCNLNLQWCGYRAKHENRMTAEVNWLAKRYRSLDFAFTDNSLPLKAAEKFFQATAKSSKDLRFFGEIRTIGKPETYRLYSAGGLRSIQIGIEALSDSLLHRMNKGVTVMDNIAALKYAAEAGIELDGNLILEFPGSTENEVNKSCEVLDFILPYRPLSAAGFFLGHGSPVWENPAKYGLHAVRHHTYNRLLYPKDILDNIQMIVHSYHGDRIYQQNIWKPVRKKILAWQQFHASRKTTRFPLTYRDGGDFLIIRQERPGKETQHHRLQGLSRKIYLACRQPCSTEKLLKETTGLNEKALVRFLEDLHSKRLLFHDRGLCLALAVKEE